MLGPIQQLSMPCRRIRAIAACSSDLGSGAPAATQPVEERADVYFTAPPVIPLMKRSRNTL
jgi:hypothetical protein